MSVPVASSLGEVYGEGAALEGARQRYGRVARRFEEEYGSPPEFFVRAPGRVNLVGEHVDYSGFGVLPMALERDVVCAVSTMPVFPGAPAARVVELRVANADAAAYPPRSFEFRADPRTGVPEAAVDASRPHWTNYFLCGFKGLVEEAAARVPYSCVRVMVHGTVPPGSGLSSSSALVVAAALCAMRAGTPGPERQPSAARLAAVTARSERFVGVEGGGMDQAISLLARRGVAQHVQFRPVRAEPVPLPAGHVWCVCHSLVESHKQRTAATQYNKRVVEVRLATRLLGRALGAPGWAACANLHDLALAAGTGLAEMADAAARLLPARPLTADEADLALAADGGIAAAVEGLGNAGPVVDEARRSGGTFDVRARAAHVYGEAARVRAFRDECAAAGGDEPAAAAAVAQRLGRILRESHDSCARLFECSCDELDALARACDESGAAGARLTGAGWGGCVVALVPAAAAAEFERGVFARYYDGLEAGRVPADRGSFFFFSPPGHGAAVLELPPGQPPQ